MKDRSNKSLWVIVGIFLLGIAALIILLRPDRQGTGHASGTGKSRGDVPHRFNPTHLGRDGDGKADGAGTREGTEPPVVSISGIGPLPYKRVIREMNLNDILYKCSLLTEGGYERRLRTGSKTVANVYLNEKNEIVHMGYGKGLYRTYSRDREAMASFDRNDMPGGGGLRIVAYGISGLTLDNIPLLKSFIRQSLITAVSNPDNPHLEVELTPVIVEVTKNFQGDPKYIGRQFSMMLEKRAWGPLPASEHREDFLEFHPMHMVRREWALIPFLPDPEDENGMQPRIGGGGPFDEPLLDAWLEKYPDKEAASH